ncbi:hypothetical protein ACVIYL_000241 [Bradyrhizobium sp. USDA 3315]
MADYFYGLAAYQKISQRVHFVGGPAANVSRGI